MRITINYYLYTQQRKRSQQTMMATNCNTPTTNEHTIYKQTILTHISYCICLCDLLNFCLLSHYTINYYIFCCPLLISQINNCSNCRIVLFLLVFVYTSTMCALVNFGMFLSISKIFICA